MGKKGQKKKHTLNQDVSWTNQFVRMQTRYKNPVCIAFICWLVYTCRVWFAPTSNWCDTKHLISTRRIWHISNNTSPPRFKTLSQSEQQQFTRCQTIPLETSMFVNDAGDTSGTFYSYDKRHINSLLNSAKSLVKMIQLHGIHKGCALNARKTRQRMPKPNELYLLEALQQLKLTDANVLIIGSQSPWHQVLCLAFGAEKVDTIEYNRLSYDHSQLNTYTTKEFWKASFDHTISYDVILSISSYDHDGLGRYGDPIAPDGDLLSMQQLHKATFFTNTTKLILTVPLGEDLLAWNLMRIYGEIRLPLLLNGYNVFARYGYDAEKAAAKFGGNQNFRQSYEPVFVVGKKKE